MSDLGNRQVMAENIRYFMDGYGMSTADLSRALGISYTTVSDWVKGKTYPRIDKIEAIANLFKIDKKDLVEKKNGVNRNLNPVNLVRIPIYSWLSCGKGSLTDELPIDEVALPAYMMFSGKAFANHAQGDSMEPTIHDGDLIIFQETPEVESGRIGSFSLNGKYYCKRFKQFVDGSCWLLSDNPEYPPIPIRPEDDFRTLGLYKLKLSKEQ